MQALSGEYLSEVGARECASTPKREIVSVRPHARRVVPFGMSARNEKLIPHAVSFCSCFLSSQFAFESLFFVEGRIFFALQVFVSLGDIVFMF